ncbi:MAG: tRNA (adenosine(37)-N6)-dimethylallyltransferase MiaA [Akkermansiaceae bacterium]|nr:tRNA (adenosine(37)-N6)-dimethylallyltransferase MiaA [Armatimonadota bacterium]
MKANRHGEEPPLLVVVGPTACGKTGVAVALSEHLDGEVISADAVAVYKNLNIGAAKPDESEKARAVFHLIDVAEPDEDFTLADFESRASLAIADIRSRGKTPILAGGTGLYVRSVTATLSVPSVAPQGNLRERFWAEVAEFGAGALHARLQTIDPVSAEKILPGDAKRLIRALEVYEVTGKPMSSFHTPEGIRGVPKPNTYLFGLQRERAELYQRIETRVDAMMDAGFLPEVQGLLAQGYSASLKSMSSLGYRHLIRHLTEGQPLTEAIEDLKRDTRRFAKRQISWFRADSEVVWLPVGKDSSAKAIAGAMVTEWEKRIAGAET